MTNKQLDSYALEWIKLRSLTLAKSINKTTTEELRIRLALGFEAGESTQQLTKRIEGYFTGNAKYRAEMISRTETKAAYNEGALHRYETSGVEKSEFYPSPDACEECLPLAGEYITKDSHNIIPIHPNCRCIWLPIVGDSGLVPAQTEFDIDSWLSGKDDLPLDTSKPIRSDEYMPSAKETEWANNLNSAEQRAIESWQSGGTNQIRELQRTGVGDKWTKDTLANLDAAVDRANAYKGTVYRGLHDLSDEAYQSLLGSREISLNAYTSATVNKARAEFFIQPIGSRETKSVLFQITNKTGVNIATASGETFKREVEVLLKKGTSYKIQGVTPTKFVYRDNIVGVNRVVDGSIIRLVEIIP